MARLDARDRVSFCVSWASTTTETLGVQQAGCPLTERTVSPILLICASPRSSHRRRNRPGSNIYLLVPPSQHRRRARLTVSTLARAHTADFSRVIPVSSVGFPEISSLAMMDKLYSGRCECYSLSIRGGERSTGGGADGSAAVASFLCMFTC